MWVPIWMIEVTAALVLCYYWRGWYSAMECKQIAEKETPRRERRAHYAGPHGFALKVLTIVLFGCIVGLIPVDTAGALVSLAAAFMLVGSTVRIVASDIIGRKPVNLMMRALGDMDDSVLRDALEKAIPELKAAEATVGSVKDVWKAREAIHQRIATYIPSLEKITAPQRHNIVPGSREALIDAKVRALSTDAVGQEYRRIVDEVAKQARSHDYTVGDLAELDLEYCLVRSEYGCSDEANSRYLGRRDYYTSIESGPLPQQLLHKAREQTVRQILMDALDDGARAQFVEVRSRIVSLIIVEEAIRKQRNEAQAQVGTPLIPALLMSFAFGIHKLLRAMMGQSSLNQSLFINEDIAAAMRLSKSTKPSPV